MENPNNWRDEKSALETNEGLILPKTLDHSSASSTGASPVDAIRPDSSSSPPSPTSSSSSGLPFSKNLCAICLDEIKKEDGKAIFTAFISSIDTLGIRTMPGLTMEMEPQLGLRSVKRALDLFSPLHCQFALPDPESKRIRLCHKIQVGFRGASKPTRRADQSNEQQMAPSNALTLEGPKKLEKGATENALAVGPTLQPRGTCKSTAILGARNLSTAALKERITSRWPRPEWHAPWKNYRVIQGHLGWVRSVAFDPSNKWFYTGSADRTIKMWDVATGVLKLTLTGHIGQVRGLAISKGYPYMFSAGDDKQVKQWDLYHNQVIRSYHGHLSGVYCLALHEGLNLLLTGGRDSVCRVWDIGSGKEVFTLSGHESDVFSVLAYPLNPQVVTGSHDTTIKLWDLRYNKPMTTTLTHHKKTVRAMALHPEENNAFVSASADNIKKFSLPKGEFCHNMLSQQRDIINAAAVNKDGVMVTGGDKGSLWFWDWKSGHNFQQAEAIVQPGSLKSEAGIYAACYDQTGTRLVTCEADKTIKMWKEDMNATRETHPLSFRPPKEIRRF